MVFADTFFPLGFFFRGVSLALAAGSSATWPVVRESLRFHPKPLLAQGFSHLLGTAPVC